MERRNAGRWLALGVVFLVGIVLIQVGHRIIQHPLHGGPGARMLGTRVMAVAYLLCDVAICSSLVTLLVTRDRRAPAWIERRLPSASPWLWHFLLGLTILSYLALAPTFLFFLIRLEHLRK